MFGSWNPASLWGKLLPYESFPSSISDIGGRFCELMSPQQKVKGCSEKFSYWACSFSKHFLTFFDTFCFWWWFFAFIKRLGQIFFHKLRSSKPPNHTILTSSIVWQSASHDASWMTAPRWYTATVGGHSEIGCNSGGVAFVSRVITVTFQ